ncbi:MAG: class B sortase [Oscillospiraceae bacterium]|nr:class B sortase [Oscillospiraceae bacterium]
MEPQELFSARRAPSAPAEKPAVVMDWGWAADLLAKGWHTTQTLARQAIARADGAVDFFIGLLRQWYHAVEQAFFPGRGKMVAQAAGCVCCVLFVGAALAFEPTLQPQLVQSAAPAVKTPASVTEEPFDLNLLLAEYEQRASAQAAAAPITVSVAPEQQLSLSMDSLKNYELASAPAGWTVDLSALEGSGRERAAYCHDYINSDTIGWLQIPGTNIDYPVMQGAILTTYMSLDINRNYSYNGSLWVDTDINNSSTNTVIFGHNWTNVSGNPSVGRSSDVMFAQLPAFAHLWFAQRVPYFYYSTTSQDLVWQVFAAFYTTDLDFYLYTSRTGSALQSIIDKGRSLSLHHYGVNVSSSDRIVTLSTCTRALGSGENQRFVVMAKLVSSGDAGVQIT